MPRGHRVHLLFCCELDAQKPSLMGLDDRRGQPLPSEPPVENAQLPASRRRGKFADHLAAKDVRDGEERIFQLPLRQ